MSNEPADSNNFPALATPLNAKSPHSLTSDTKMFIPSPNVLSHISLDKIVKEEASVTEMNSSNQSSIPMNKTMSSEHTLIDSQESPQTSRRGKKRALENRTSPCTENEIKVPEKRGRKQKLNTSKDQSQSDTSVEQSQSNNQNVYNHRYEKDTDTRKNEYHSPVRLEQKLESVLNNSRDNSSTNSSPIKTIVDDQLSLKPQEMLKSSPDTLIKGRRKSKISIEKVSLSNNQDTNTEGVINTRRQSKRSCCMKKQTRLEDYLKSSHNNSISPQKTQEETKDIKPVLEDDSNCKSNRIKDEDDGFPTLQAKSTESIVNGSLKTDTSVETEDHIATNVNSNTTTNEDTSHNGEINTSIADELNNITLRRRGRPRGRGRGKAAGRAGKSQRSMDTFTKGDSGTLNPSNSVTCNKCEAVMDKKQWATHNMYKHNNMSWIKGGTPMNFDLDIKLWKRVLTPAHKKKGQLTCEQCATVKRSVNGFISHMQFCGKTDEERRNLMATCPICNSVMMPSSMEIHERSHRQTAKKNAERIMLLKSEETTGRQKRRSAQEALTKISETATMFNADNDKSSVKDAKAFQKNVIMLSKDKSKIPSTWISAWKKELKGNNAASCRHIGCTYSSATYEDICKHCTICSFRLKESYFCKVCQFASESKENMLKHVEQEHSLDEEYDGSPNLDDEDEYSDDSQNEECNSKKRKPKVPKTREVTAEKSNEAVKYRFVNKFKFMDGEVSQGAKFGQPYIPSLRWTMEFEQKHFEFELFEEHRPNEFLLIENSSKYLPELQTSMRCKTKKKSMSNKPETKDIAWKTWARFEGGFDEGVPTFFVGGPIWALAWLPIPAPLYSKKPNQYVAISTHPTMENQYKVGKSYVGPNVIQIWNVGHLNNASVTPEDPPSFSYGIVHNNGTVWCLQWCPSGCYQDANLNNYNTNENENSLRRMGMLAAACSDGCVHIYSLPFPEELKKHKQNKFPIYETQPVFTLVVNTSIYDAKEQNWQCTKLSWTKEHKHNMIAAGFSNGYIALWDLTIKSPYLMEKRQATYFINAFQHIFAHRNAISMVAIVPYNGQRFLASGSIDKSYKLWDLEDITTPQACVKKGIITDGAWLLNWPGAALSFDDAYAFQRTCSIVIPVREYAYKVLTILPTNSVAYSLAVNDYANAFAHGTLSGDIVTIFPHRLLYRSEKMSQRRRLSSFVQVVDLKQTQNKKTDKKTSKDYNYMPSTYKDSKDRFGMVFNDKQKDNWTRLERSSVNPDDLTSFPIEQYPFASVNQLSWNPNSWSHLWIICGYQSGIVRLLSFKPSPMNSVYTTLIPWHAQQMMEKKRKPR